MGIFCKGKCEQFKHKPKSVYHKGVYWYLTGLKRCTVCDIFIKWNGLNCPCCCAMLRTKSRNHKKVLIQ